MKRGIKISIVISAIIGLFIGYAPRAGSIEEAEEGHGE